MFGVLEANKAHSSAGQGLSHNRPGNYAVASNRTYSNGEGSSASMPVRTYSNGEGSSASMPVQAGDLVTMELKAGKLSVCNLRSGQVVRVDVPRVSITP